VTTLLTSNRLGSLLTFGGGGSDCKALFMVPTQNNANLGMGPYGAIDSVVLPAGESFNWQLINGTAVSQTFTSEKNHVFLRRLMASTDKVTVRFLARA
jgi:hypothetical protein